MVKKIRYIASVLVLMVGLIIFCGIIVCNTYKSELINTDSMFTAAEKVRMLIETRDSNLPKKEALQHLFLYLFDNNEDKLQQVSFYEDELIGYKWEIEYGYKYLQESSVSSDNQYIFFIFYDDLYDADGRFMYSQRINEYAVNIVNYEVIERRIYFEDGTWGLNQEYLDIQ